MGYNFCESFYPGSALMFIMVAFININWWTHRLPRGGPRCSRTHLKTENADFGNLAGLIGLAFDSVNKSRIDTNGGYDDSA